MNIVYLLQDVLLTVCFASKAFLTQVVYNSSAAVLDGGEKQFPLVIKHYGLIDLIPNQAPQKTVLCPEISVIPVQLNRLGKRHTHSLCSRGDKHYIQSQLHCRGVRYHIT